MNTAIDIHNLTVIYSQKPVLWNVDGQLPEGQLIGIVGPNGAGKSTFLKAIMDLIPVANGKVSFFGEALDQHRKRIAYIPQRQSIDWDFPTTVYEVVVMGHYPKKGLFGKLNANDHQKVEESLKQVGMWEFRNRQIAELSGGQQQRVFLARALCQKADLYLMDEPFAGVDAATEEAILDLLKKLRSEGKTVVVVHHDLQTVQTYFDWVMLLNGHLVGLGPMEEVFTEENLKATYGGTLTVLSKMGQLIQSKSFPIRE